MIEKDDKVLRIRLLERQLKELREEMNGKSTIPASAKRPAQHPVPEAIGKDTEEIHVIEALFGNSPLPLLILSQNLNVRMANQSFRDVFKVKKPEGRSIYDLNNKQWNVQALQKLLEEIVPRDKIVNDYEIELTFPEIGKRRLRLNAEEISYSKFEKLIILYIEDITDGMRAGEGDALLAAIVESSEDAIISKTLTGIVTTWNGGAEKLFGYTSAEMIGQPIMKIIPRNRIDEEPEIIRKIKNGETIAHFETQGLDRNNELIDISLTISPIKDRNGNIVGASKIARDIRQEIDARKKMEESEKRFHQLIYSSPTGICNLKGEEFIITAANKPIIEIWGKDSDVIGRKYFDVLPELVEQGLVEIFTRVYKTGKPYNASETHLSIFQKGVFTSKYYSYTLYAQYDANNEINGIGIIASDVTSQALYNKRIRESEERFRTLTETLPQLIWVTDGQGKGEFASSRWEEYSGVDPAAENAWKAVLHPDEYERMNAAWLECLTTGIAYKSEVRLKSRTGEYRWHSVEAANVKDSEGMITKWIGAFTDIHEQKLKEEKKDEFMGIASHEMKTPLTTAKAYLQMLEVSLNESHIEAKLFANKASQSVDKLNELIAELLDVSKIQFGKLNYSMSRFDFNKMVQHTVENVQLTSPANIIVKTGKVNKEVIGDESRLEQVVINLLSNAIKYSPQSEKIFITLSQEEDTIKVSVKDNGIGIAEENLIKIFDKYHRVEEHAVKFQGMGVGLFISHEIIQRHGGRLWAESKEGMGSTFYFTLPVNGALQA